VNRSATPGFVPATLGATRATTEHTPPGLDRNRAYDRLSEVQPAILPPPLPQKTKPAAARHDRAVPPATDTPPRRADTLAGIVELTDDEVKSFKALGAEVTLRTSDGEKVVLVPERTDATDRIELTVDSLRVITRMCEIFKVANVKCERVEAGEQLDIRMNPEAREVRAGGLPSDLDEA
jgi:hypothetical protein